MVVLAASLPAEPQEYCLALSLQVAKLLGSNAHIIQSELLKLLNDDSTEVGSCTVIQLPAVVPCVGGGGGTAPV